MRSLLLSSLFVITSCSSSSAKYAVEDLEVRKVVEFNCAAHREFIVAYEYLKTIEQAKLGGEQKENLALNVAKGCSGAGEEFVRTAETLIKAGVDSRAALMLARDAAKKGPRAATGFRSIFKLSYANDALDLDLARATKLARELTIDWKGSTPAVDQDFADVVQVCLHDKNLNFPRPQCAELAARIAKMHPTQASNKGEAFKKLYIFLTKKLEPSLPPQEAVQLSEKMIAVSPFAPREFIQTYAYAAAEEGLKLPHKEALGFAVKVAEQTRQETFDTRERSPL